MSNKALKHIFNKIYNGGLFTDLVIKQDYIKKLNDFYKNNFADSKSFDDLLDRMGSLRSYIELSKAAKTEFEKQFKVQKGLQPAVLTECFVAQTVANILSLNHFIDVDQSERHIPLQLAKNFLAFEGVTGKAYPRYIYHNNNYSIILLQYGDSSSIDAIFIKDRSSVRIEFKEEKSKLTEPDIPEYDENGKLIINTRFKNKYSDYIEFIDKFNEKTSMFELMGHNFNIFEYLNEENTTRILNEVFRVKIIDLYVFQKGDQIYPVLTDDLLKNVDMSGSEIRTAGRNHKKVFTPVFAKETIIELGGCFIDSRVVLPFSKEGLNQGKTISKNTRYKLNSLLFVYLEKTQIIDGFVYFEYKDLRQLKPTISLHIEVEIDKDVLLEEFNLLNSY